MKEFKSEPTPDTLSIPLVPHWTYLLGFQAVETPTDTPVVWWLEIPATLPLLCQCFWDGPDESALVSAINVTALINHRWYHYPNDI